MIHRHAFEAVDRLLRETKSAPEILIRGKWSVFGGELRQILPVLPGASS
jgi:hypothetical protein